MRDKEHKYRHIYRLYKQGLTYRQIARREIPDDLSVKTVRNIIYHLRAHPEELDQALPRHKEIYALYEEALLQGMKPSKAILYAHDNQPDVHVCLRTISAAVSREEGRRKSKDTALYSRAHCDPVIGE